MAWKIVELDLHSASEEQIEELGIGSVLVVVGEGKVPKVVGIGCIVVEERGNREGEHTWITTEGARDARESSTMRPCASEQRTHGC